MTTKDEALALALETLEESLTYIESPSWSPSMGADCRKAITAIKQAITPETGNSSTPEASAITSGNGQQAQEPVTFEQARERGVFKPAQDCCPTWYATVLRKEGWDAAMAAPKQAEPAWQPIESAPKGGSEILLGHANGDCIVGYWGHARNSFIRDYAWCDGSTDLAVTWPTHWMPLPQPPEAKA